jgi:CheY-like chemotaxis protein
MKILFVEDNAMNRRVIREMLRAADLPMDEAEDGVQALAMVDEVAYDLILMDLRMPGMDGLTVVRRIRARGDAKGRVPIIVVTADSAADLQERCRMAGADGLLLKPVSMEALFDAIGAVALHAEAEPLIA